MEDNKNMEEHIGQTQKVVFSWTEGMPQLVT